MESLKENLLNVMLLEPRQKHPAIFSRFAEMREGESFIILNDHDPKPLYYQMQGELGNVFTWEYLEQGPELWRVKIGRKSPADRDDTIGQIAAKDIRKAEVFKKYGLDFCCGGKKTIHEACLEKGLDVLKVQYELQQTDNTRTVSPIPFNEWEPDFLADYIVNTHHRYVKKMLPDMMFFMKKVEAVHGSHHPELKELKRMVAKVNNELGSHLMKEEEVLFPYIKKICAAYSNGKPVNAEAFGKVNHPVNMMEIEHEEVGNTLAQMRSMTNNFTPPPDACASFKLLYSMLDEFENDLHLHVHLENNILFPKAIELERKTGVVQAVN